MTKKPAITRAQARVLLFALVPDGVDPTKLTPKGRAELRAAVDLILELAGL
jgi:hypothetical protein